MRKGRFAKTLEQKLQDLDSHLYLLRESRQGLSESSSHLKAIATELRALICFSSDTEGLLWRLVDELGVDDRIFLHVPGKLRRDHPMAQGLKFYIVPVQRGGKGHPKLPPDQHSLKYIVKECESVFAGGKPLTYEYLIKAVAQQMGSAHEADGLEPALVELKSVLAKGPATIIHLLCMITELTLEVGERVLDLAEKKLGFHRTYHKHDYGNVSIALRLRVKQQLAGRIPLILFHSYVSDVEILCSASPAGLSFTIKKQGKEIKDLTANYPADWTPGAEAVFILSYCSKTKQVRTITNGQSHETVNLQGLGCLHASDLMLEQNNVDYIDFVEKQFLLTYDRLLSPEDSEGLYKLPPNAYGLWKFSHELESQSPFPD